MGYRQITPPSAQPVTLAEAKAQLRVDHSDEDALITRLITAATSYLDGRTGILGRCLVTQTWELTLDAFPAEEIELPLGPVASVVSVSYVDTAGATQVLAGSSYYFDDASLSEWIVPVSDWPATQDVANAVTVRFIAGTAAASVPEAIRHAILLLVGHWYEARAGVSESAMASVPLAFDALIAPFRRIPV